MCVEVEEKNVTTNRMKSMTATAVLVMASALPAAAKSLDVQPWSAPGISSAKFESHAAFDPVTGEFYFVRSSPSFEGWRILSSRCGKTGWSAPRDASFAGDGVEADPWFTPDGRDLYFISSRSTDGIKRKDLDIWHMRRAAGGGWEKPERMPAPVNSSGNEWFPRLAKDGWLYFGSDRASGLGKTDIWRARVDKKDHWVVENAGAGLNTPDDEYEPLPSPDGKTLIMMADGGLYQSRSAPGGWSKRVKLPPPVNVNGSEIGAAFSPSGNSLLFARDTKGAKSGEWFVWHIAGNEAWPPVCPAHRG